MKKQLQPPISLHLIRDMFTHFAIKTSHNLFQIIHNTELFKNKKKKHAHVKYNN